MNYFSKILARSAVAAGLFLAAPPAVMADPIATVLSIQGTATGPNGPIDVGDRIEDGLVIRTNSRTQMELRFDDATLMAIGPNSELEITSVLMTSGSQAGRFAINAAAGSFRFLSGDSQRDAYEITTPASTIGIRGTTFDIFVEGDVTAVLLYQGALNVCLTQGGRCWAFRGSCYVAVADLSRGTARGLRSPEIRDILSLFIYSQSQQSLSDSLRAGINSCNKHFPNDRDPASIVDEIIEEPTDEIDEGTDEETDEESLASESAQLRQPV